MPARAPRPGALSAPTESAAALSNGPAKTLRLRSPSASAEVSRSTPQAMTASRLRCRGSPLREVTSSRPEDTEVATSCAL